MSTGSTQYARGYSDCEAQLLARFLEGRAENQQRKLTNVILDAVPERVILDEMAKRKKAAS